MHFQVLFIILVTCIIIEIISSLLKLASGNVHLSTHDQEGSTIIGDVPQNKKGAIGIEQDRGSLHVQWSYYYCEHDKHHHKIPWLGSYI